MQVGIGIVIGMVIGIEVDVPDEDTEFVRVGRAGRGCAERS